MDLQSASCLLSVRPTPPASQLALTSSSSLLPPPSTTHSCCTPPPFFALTTTDTLSHTLNLTTTHAHSQSHHSHSRHTTHKIHSASTLSTPLSVGRGTHALARSHGLTNSHIITNNIAHSGAPHARDQSGQSQQRAGSPHPGNPFTLRRTIQHVRFAVSGRAFLFSSVSRSRRAGVFVFCLSLSLSRSLLAVLAGRVCLSLWSLCAKYSSIASLYFFVIASLSRLFFNSPHSTNKNESFRHHPGRSYGCRCLRCWLRGGTYCPPVPLLLPMMPELEIRSIVLLVFIFCKTV